MLYFIDSWPLLIRVQPKKYFGCTPNFLLLPNFLLILMSTRYSEKVPWKSLIFLAWHFFFNNNTIWLAPYLRLVHSHVVNRKSVSKLIHKIILEFPSNRVWLVSEAVPNLVTEKKTPVRDSSFPARENCFWTSGHHWFRSYHSWFQGLRWRFWLWQ